jgi:hypothetical protein
MCERHFKKSGKNLKLHVGLVECICINYVTPWSRVLPEKLTGLKLLNKFPAFYETPRFISAFTRARHLPYLETKIVPKDQSGSETFVFDL